MFSKHLLVYINSKVPFHENLPTLPSHRSGVPDASLNNRWKAGVKLPIYKKLKLTIYKFKILKKIQVILTA
jgi:hypothetical protein